MPSSNSRCTIRSSERNKHHPWIVATATIHGTRTCMRIISYDGEWASVRAVHVLWLISTADSRTERLRVLLTASTSPHCTAHMYLIQPSLMSAGFPKKTKKHHPRIVAAASDRSNTIYFFIDYCITNRLRGIDFHVNESVSFCPPIIKWCHFDCSFTKLS